jgi:hypothetical protein
MELRGHQQKALEELSNGKILWGGVGTGKSFTAVKYYELREAPRDVYVITTAKKRDSHDWEREFSHIGVGTEQSVHGRLVVDSWNNIQRYINITGAFFIFDEQRLVGSGAWVKAFIKLARRNHWILLSATPGDTWMDYVPVFVANGYYANRTEFKRRHVRRLAKAAELLQAHPKVILFYNFDYELELLRSLCVPNPELSSSGNTPLVGSLRQFGSLETPTAPTSLALTEWNGHKHQRIPLEHDRWVYLVQYTAGAEGWNCTDTDTMIFYSLNYSFKIFHQSQGRIDRLNTPYRFLTYYVLGGKSWIDLAIRKSLREKRDFSETPI